MRGTPSRRATSPRRSLLYGGLAGGLFALGWWIGGIRLGSVFLVVGLLMAATVYWYGPRVILASLGARELQLAESPALHSTVERLALARRRRAPEALPHRRRPPARALRRPRSRRLGDRPHAGPAHAAAPGGAGRRPRPRARPRAPSRRPRPDAGRPDRGLARRGEPDRRLPRARRSSSSSAPSRRASSRSSSPRSRELARRPARRRHLRIAAPARGRARPHRAGEELVRFQGSPVTEPLYIVNPFEPVGLAAMFSTHPPVGERVAAPPRARSRVAREAARGLAAARSRR